MLKNNFIKKRELELKFKSKIIKISLSSNKIP
jgi:hypothetical protein